VKSGRSRGASTIAITAALSVAILIAAVGSYIGEAARTHHAASEAIAREPAEMQKYVPVSDADGNGTPDWQDELMRAGVVTATSSDATTTESLSDDPAASSGANLIQSLIGGYLSLKQSNQYTAANGEKLATNIAAGFQAPTIFVPHALGEILVDNDASEKRVLQYRADMRGALAPVVDLNAEPEFSLFARFIQTKDPSWLEKLSATAANYRKAEQDMLKVRVPANAVDAHLRAINATGTFAETLERLVRFSNDPLALMSLLRTYNDSEREFLLAFDALAKYYVQNVSSN
jgi:hypothetical protein